jgi:ring-1,2-phenylacetyl-CoA epoxidase subunit PaaD
MVNVAANISVERVWELLDEIPDPDIPVISIVELGIVRNVEITDENKVVVTITPSYSGCPAMNLFKTEIKAVLENKGASNVEIKISHSPVWTTDWISEGTKEKLKKYGIAPPEHSTQSEAALFSIKKITCPNCNSIHTSLTSQFGSTPCKALWYCNDCNQPFEYFKCY